MFNSIALNVVIGLIFIFLLYSLLATVISEMIASVLGLRARTLKSAISRMLNDEKVQSFFKRFWNSLRIMKTPDNEIINGFYNSPEIKYLGGTGLFSKPSFIKASSFSKTLVDELAGPGKVTSERITAVLKASAHQAGHNGAGVTRVPIDRESAEYVLTLWEEAEADVVRFKKLIEDWFNRTMEQASEWYKRKIQLVLLVLGFCMAWFFYADTFQIVKTLSKDKDAREQLVLLAEAYSKSNPAGGEASLSEVKKKLDMDVANANAILGLGGWLPEQMQVVTDPNSLRKTYSSPVDPVCLPLRQRGLASGTLKFTFGDKLTYLLLLAYHHFFGFLLTAIAVSLGAPFWFDLLNKVMKLRTGGDKI
jgi:hypothetical protein